LTSSLAFVMATPVTKSSEEHVETLFDVSNLSGSPFPSNRFTVPDASQLTGLHVNLPKPDCVASPSDCQDIDVLNTVDGFNLQPRLSIPFNGSIDVDSVTNESVFVVSLGSAEPGGDPGGRIVGINQIVWDTFTNTLYVESNELLEQHTRYVLVATKGLRDAGGQQVKAAKGFLDFVDESNSASTADPVLDAYRTELRNALTQIDGAGVTPRGQVVAASVFTTQSATVILEKIRDQIKAQAPEPADFLLGPEGMRTVFPRNEVASITFRQQTRDNPPAFTSIAVPVNLLDFVPGAVGTLAFGKYRSPDYEVHPGEFIPAVATRTGTPEVQGTNEIYFNLFLPSGDKPVGGWPVAILGHGSPSNKDLFPFRFAASMAAQGIATIAINVVGHGFGPLGTLTVNRTLGNAVTFSSGGRGVDQNGDGVIGNTEGVEAAAPRTIVERRDGVRQTAVDLMQLVHLIEVGVDIDGDTLADLNSERVYYFGQSVGGMYGSILLGVEPRVQAGVLAFTGGSDASSLRLSPANRPDFGTALAERSPSLINPPGLTEIAGVTVRPPYFNENEPLRNEPPAISTVPGASAIQTWLENVEWVSMSGNPLAYVSHLVKAPLPGMLAKSVIYQFAYGDETVPNPATTALLRAGGLADRATFLRNDLAVAEDDTVPREPHAFWNRIDFANPLVRAIARGGQEQIAIFFASDGTVVIHPEPARFFEVPIVLPLPERLNFIR
jgi:hypothetical protein